MAKNPFQSGDRQHFPAYSPSIFCAPKTPCSSEKNGSFRWSIDHIALLNPADINTKDMQQDTSPVNDLQAQRSVERFFSQRMIVPSPWTQDKVASKHVTFSPHPPDTAYIRDESFNESTNGKMVDACCQTAVTIPLNWDLEAMLGAECVYHEEEDLRVKENGNTSLRRKLFGQPQRRSPNGEENPVAVVPSESTSPRDDTTSPVPGMVTTGADNMAATPGIVITKSSPSSSQLQHRSSFHVDHSPFHVMSPIVATPDSQSPPDLGGQVVASPKLSPIQSKSIVTPDGLAVSTVQPSSGKSTSTPVSRRNQPVATQDSSDNSDDDDHSSQSSGDHTPELLSLDDLKSNTYELTGITMGTTLSTSPIGEITNPTTTTMSSGCDEQVTNHPPVTSKPSTINHGGTKSVCDSGIVMAGSSVELSTQLRDDSSNNHVTSNSQHYITKQQGEIPSSLTSTSETHNQNYTVDGSGGVHYKELFHSRTAADSGLGWYKAMSSTPLGLQQCNTTAQVSGNIPMDTSDLPPATNRGSSTDSGANMKLRSGFDGVLLPSKCHPTGVGLFEGSTPRSRYVQHKAALQASLYDDNRWAWLVPRSTNGESFTSVAEDLLLKKEILKSQLQFGPVSGLYDYSRMSPSHHPSFSRHSSDSYPTTPLSSRVTGPATVRYRSPLSDKVFNRNHSKLTRLHLGSSFRSNSNNSSRFNKLTLDNNSAPLSPTHFPGTGSHTSRLWSNENMYSERYNEWKRSMDQWESVIRSQYSTIDT